MVRAGARFGPPRDRLRVSFVSLGLVLGAIAFANGCAAGGSGTSGNGGGGSGGMAAKGGADGGGATSGKDGGAGKAGSGGTSTGGSGGTSATGGAGSGATAGGGGECSGSAEQPCYTGAPGTEGVGECKPGKRLCENGSFGACEGEVVPTAEVCDNRDNDCNGLVDEELGQSTCGQGVCQVSVDNCVNGAEQTCTPNTGNATEACDGADDNCDGQVDEGCSCQNGQTQACYSADPATKGVGLCKAGTQTCSNGKWGTCAGEVVPKAEACNALDDDCDGDTDEGNPQGGQDCNTGKQGECSKGVTTCTNNTLACKELVTPSNEVCDGKDNNCNGTVDDGNPGSGQVCSTGKPGICSGGTTQCQSGAIKCVQNQQAGTETCDGKDNDCDSTVDEGCNCLDGATQGCYTGPPGTAGTGVCKGGTQTCANGAWGACAGQVTPSTEACNNLDDNCNGTKDENNPGGGAACSTGKPGICGPGTMTCQSGSLACVQNQQPAANEVCNNSLDDNCNGQTDENCGCAHDKCSTGVKLVSGCDAATGGCVAKVCAADVWCCNDDWDSLCVQEVRTVCGSLKCAEAQGSCAHSLCIPDLGPLVSGCDSAKADCVAQVCSFDSFCCEINWDSFCVDEVATFCGKNCQ